MIFERQFVSVSFVQTLNITFLKSFSLLFYLMCKVFSFRIMSLFYHAFSFLISLTEFIYIYINGKEMGKVFFFFNCITNMIMALMLKIMMG